MIPPTKHKSPLDALRPRQNKTAGVRGGRLTDEDSTPAATLLLQVGCAPPPCAHRGAEPDGHHLERPADLPPGSLCVADLPEAPHSWSVLHPRGTPRHRVTPAPRPIDPSPPPSAATAAADPQTGCSSSSCRCGARTRHRWPPPRGCGASGAGLLLPAAVRGAAGGGRRPLPAPALQSPSRRRPVPRGQVRGACLRGRKGRGGQQDHLLG